MDPARFDQFSRSIAQRFSRRRAIGWAGVSGLVAALASPAIRQGSAQDDEPVTCSLLLHAETATGPNENVAYDDELTIEIEPSGAVDKGTLTVTSFAYDVKGQVTGRSIRLRIAFEDGRELTLAGVSQQAIQLCRRDIAGVFSGPEMRDLGTWVASTGRESSGADVTPAAGQVGEPGQAPPSGEPTPTACPPMPCELDHEFDPAACDCVCPAPRTVCNGYCCPTAMGCDPATGNCQCGQEGTEFCGGVCVPGCRPDQRLGADCGCVDQCAPGSLFCNNDCVAHLQDPANCGACRHVCASGEHCVGGACTVCPTPYGCQGICCVFHEDPNTISVFSCSAGLCLCRYACSAYCGSAGEDVFTLSCDLDPRANCFDNCPPIVSG